MQLLGVIFGKILPEAIYVKLCATNGFSIVTNSDLRSRGRRLRKLNDGHIFRRVTDRSITIGNCSGVSRQ